MSSEGAYANIYDDLGTMELHLEISSKLVVRKVLSKPYMRIFVKGETENVDWSSPAKGTLSWLRHTPIGLANRRSQVCRGKVPYRRKSSFGASEQALKRSCPRKEPTQTPRTILAFCETLFRLKLSSEMHLRAHTRVSLKKETPRTRPSVLTQREPHLGYARPPTG